MLFPCAISLRDTTEAESITDNCLHTYPPPSNRRFIRNCPGCQVRVASRALGWGQVPAYTRAAALVAEAAQAHARGVAARPPHCAPRGRVRGLSAADPRSVHSYARSPQLPAAVLGGPAAPAKRPRPPSRCAPPLPPHHGPPGAPDSAPSWCATAAPCPPRWHGAERGPTTTRRACPSESASWPSRSPR